MRRAASFACKLAMFLVFGTAHVCAETFSLYLSAPVECPRRSALVEQVRARTERAQSVHGSGNLHFDVAIQRDRHGVYWGTLVSRLRTGKVSTRTLDGTSCDEVSAALAVIMALTIDPGAQSGPIAASSVGSDAAPREAGAAPPEAAPIASAAPPTAPRAEGNAPLDAGQQAASSGAARSALGQAAPPRSPQPHGRLAIVAARVSVIAPHQPNQLRSTSPTDQWSLGLQGDLSPMLAPDLGLWRVGAHASWRSKMGAVASVAAAYAPKLRRSGDQGAQAELYYVGGAVEFGWQVMRGGQVTLDVLAITAIGRLHAAGVVGPRIDTAQAFGATWVGVGPGLELRQNYAWGGAALQLAVPVGLVRPSFSLTSNGNVEPFFSVAPVGAEFRLRLYVRCLG